MIERAYYSEKISTFLNTSQDHILGQLASKHDFALDVSQRNSWIEQISTLQQNLSAFQDGSIFLEFSIPRMGKRVDVLLVIAGIIFVVECKIGAKNHEGYAIDQVMDYALDLKNFHEGSHDKSIVPILLSTRTSERMNSSEWCSDGIAKPLLSNGKDLSATIEQVLADTPTQPEIEINNWILSGYRPTPTILEAAQALYRRHSVEEISRSDAGAINLSQTNECVSEIIEHSKKNRRKSICFVTGVPGAGKTLAGLNLAIQRLKPEHDEFAVFLSGNGPLVNVLRESLARDLVARGKDNHERISKKQTVSEVSTFIQNIHHFRDEGLKSKVPVENVVVFDEAQRAWSQAQAEKFMIRKRGMSEFGMSEPEFLISVMDRKKDWCTIVALIGGGQEINTGEAGLIEWFDALQKHFNNWEVYYSRQIIDKDYSWGQDLAFKLRSLKSVQKDMLHLAVSVRSFRAETLSAFVGALIDGNSDVAYELHQIITNDYPIKLTRDLGKARRWLRGVARGTERYGLVASSGAIRLKPEGINVKAAINPIMWFLNDKNDIRSSYYLEDLATEFDIQGLELDWIGVCWEADFGESETNGLRIHLR